MNIIKSLEWRYAAKKFDDKKMLSETQIHTLKEAFNLTATSYGLQPVKMVVIKNKEIQKQLVEHSWNQEQVAQASHVIVICTQDSIKENDIEKYFDLVKKTRNTPDEILNPFKDYLKSDISNKSEDQLAFWMKNQAYIALGNLLTVAAVEEIDSCPMEGFESDKYNELLDLHEKGLNAAVIATIGYRSDDDSTQYSRKVRKSINNLFEI